MVRFRVAADQYTVGDCTSGIPFTSVIESLIEMFPREYCSLRNQKSLILLSQL